MARPIEEGLDYFPVDTDMDQDDKMYILEAECGLEGFAVAIKLLMRIYKEGYYIEWDDRTAKIFSRKKAISLDLLNNVVDVCIKEGIFNKEIYEDFSVLTSSGIQKRYFKACVRRKEVQYIPDFLLVNPEDYENLVAVNVYNNPDSTVVNVDNNSSESEKKVNVNKNPNSEGVNVNINPSSAELMLTKTPQSKVKESKVNKEEEDNKLPGTYQRVFGKLMNSYQKQKLDAYVSDDGMDLDVVIKALEITGDHGVTSPKYTFAILDDWKSRGVKTLIDAKEAIKAREQEMKKSNKITHLPHRNKSSPRKKYKWEEFFWDYDKFKEK